MAMSRNMRDALKYSAMLCEAALLRSHEGIQRANALKYFKALVRNMIEEGLTLSDAEKMFPTQRKMFVDVYHTCLREMGEDKPVEAANDYRHQ